MVDSMKENQILFEFLSDLVANNNREWFKANRARYDAAWERFHQLVDELILQVGQFD